MYFSYGQFLVYDRSEPEPGSLWTEAHVAQGFVRRERALGIGTPIQHGNAKLRVFLGRPVLLHNYDRVIAVPIQLDTGILCIEGPEEYPIERSVQLKPGGYLLFVAQTRVADSYLECDLFLEPMKDPSMGSQVLQADEMMRISGQLSESGEVAP